ncbi:MAG: hypothetical protein MJZ05_08410 [Fibrobacter sp.]|nr:hypothetical protein [Fibrobacter sp.]
MYCLIVSIAVVLFAIFPLTDTDVWWHLACAREWVTTWTPVREPVVNIHEFFQQTIAAIYNVGGAPLLVAFKALLWGSVFCLFLRRVKLSKIAVALTIVILFVFRYQFEIRPVVFSLLFLGIYWNVLPWLAQGYDDSKKRWAGAIGILFLQWIWCRCQGLYILGPIFGIATVAAYFDRNNLDRLALLALFALAMFGMPFLHSDGLLLAAYPFELLNRLVGLSPSATIFAKEIAENRSPLTLLLEGENFWTSLLMLACVVTGLVYAVKQLVGMIKNRALHAENRILKQIVLCTTAILALVAERNFVLFLPVFLNVVLPMIPELPFTKYANLVAVAFVLGLWGRSLLAYDSTMVSAQRVPVAAAEWMKTNSHDGRLFNDDRAGGYLAFVNPSDSTYIDGRFILKTADFFEQYLGFAENPEAFAEYAVQNQIGRVILPTRYYARWGKLIEDLNSKKGTWNRVHEDEYFVVFDR